MDIYPWQFDPTLPPPIKHRCLENHYTKSVSYIPQCTYTHGRLTPPSLLQSSIDLWKTITPNKFHIYIAQCTYTYGRLTPPPPPIEHRCLDNHYTK